MRVVIGSKEGCHNGQVITYIIWSIDNLIVYIVYADNSRLKGRLLLGRIMYGIRYLMWVIQVGESWCVIIGTKEG